MLEIRDKLEVIQAQPLPLGAWGMEYGVRFCVSAAEGGEPLWLLIMDKGTHKCLAKIHMDAYRVCGDICAVDVYGIVAEQIYYAYCRGEERIADPYGFKLYDCHVWSEVRTPRERCLYEPFPRHWPSMEGDVAVNRDISDLVLYKLHVLSLIHISEPTRH